MKQVIIRFLYIVVISAMCFMLILPETFAYLFFFDAVAFLVLLRYGKKENKQFLAKSAMAAFGCTISFVAVKVLTGHYIREVTAKEVVFFLAGAAEMLCMIRLCIGKRRKNKEKLPLYREREDDLERIREYLSEFEILGINAAWGNGKSFVLDYLKCNPQIQSEYEIIQIDLLSCDLDAVEVILVSELEKVFQRNRIYSENSHQLKNLLRKNEWLSMLGEFLCGNREGLSASFDGFKQELSKLDKKILIIFEDIDRISSTDTIKKIFAISEKIAGDRLRVIFQYDRHILKEKEFDRDYLEKYIPYTIDLTAIPYAKIVEYQWEEIKMEGISLDVDAVCMIGRHLSGLNQLNQIIGLNLDIHMELKKEVSIRRVRLFLSELKEILTSNQEFAGKENAETVMHIVFIKHFFSGYYDLLQIGESPLQSLKIISGDKEYTMLEMLAKFRKPINESDSQRDKRIQSLQEIMKEGQNRMACAVLLLLGYELQIDQIERQLEQITTEPVQNLRKKEKNEKIDRIVWNVLANGTSEITNAENAVRKLQQEVLSIAGAEQEKAWKKYLDDMFYQRGRKDNGTIFRFGLDPFFDLFQAMRIADADMKQWEMFLEFYFSWYQKEAQPKTISVDLISNCNYCNLGMKNVFFKVIRFVNQLEVKGNMNGETAYKDFLENYMGAVASLGYCRRMSAWMFEMADSLEKNQNQADSRMEEMIEELKRSRDEQSLDYVKEEFKDILQFVQKNQELIRCEKSLPKRDRPFSITTEGRSEWIHQEEVDRLKELKRSGQRDQFQIELKKSYTEGKIYLQELEDVLKEDCVIEGKP